MKKTSYLYGDIDRAVIETRKSTAVALIKACNKVLEELLKIPSEARDYDRINDVIKARKKNEYILEEVWKEKKMWHT